MKFNAATGEIDIENLPPELLEIFKRAGVTKKDLQNKETAKDIFMAVAKFNEDVNFKLNKSLMHLKIKCLLSLHSNKHNLNQVVVG